LILCYTQRIHETGGICPNRDSNKQHLVEWHVINKSSYFIMILFRNTCNSSKRSLDSSSVFETHHYLSKIIKNAVMAVLTISSGKWLIKYCLTPCNILFNWIWRHYTYVWRYQWGNHKSYIEGQTIEWPKEKAQRVKQWSTKHYTKN
jgi:hypothetical protein